MSRLKHGCTPQDKGPGKMRLLRLIERSVPAVTSPMPRIVRRQGERVSHCTSRSRSLDHSGDKPLDDVLGSRQTRCSMRL
jgi:hypothetical protein